jgi:uncharacterized protein (DUF2062 family)
MLHLGAASRRAVALFLQHGHRVGPLSLNATQVIDASTNTLSVILPACPPSGLSKGALAGLIVGASCAGALAALGIVLLVRWGIQARTSAMKHELRNRELETVKAAYQRLGK